MSLTLHAHPFSSFSWKALIALWADDTPFTYRNVDPADPSAMAELKSHWSLGKFPTLVDDGMVIPEASSIIEHLQAHHPGPNRWIPEGDAGRRVRLLDRVFDLHIQGNMQPTVNHAIWPEGEGLAAARGREQLKIAYDWLETQLGTEGWAVGGSFTMADCAAAPALFYADWVEPIGLTRPKVAAYRTRLLTHPAVRRAVEEARPYRHYFPLGAPERD